MVRRRGRKHNVRVEVVSALSSHVVEPARHARLQGDASANARRQHAAPQLNDVATRLVAEHQRCAYDKVANTSALPVVNVRAADADARQRDADVPVRRRRWQRPGRELQLAHTS